MKVHDDQLRDTDTGSPPLKYSPRVLVSTLPESWLISMLLREVMHTNRGPPPVGRAQGKGSVHSQTEKSRRIPVACAIRILVS